MLVLMLLALVQDERDALIKKQVADAVARLEKESASEYRIGQTALTDLGRAAEPELVKTLNTHAKAQVRALACDILGAIRAGSKETVAALIERLKDDEYFGASVASRAARALGLLADPSAIPALTDALDQSKARNDLALRFEAVSALGKLRALSAVGAIRALVADKGQTDAGQLVASAALQALVTLEARGAIEEIAVALDSNELDEWGPYPDWPISQLAVWALERLMDPKDWPTDTKSIVDAKTEERGPMREKWKGWRDNRKKVVESRAALEVVKAAVVAYKADKNELPQALKELIEGDKKYVENAGKLKDAWGQPFLYEAPGWGADYNLVSFGADGKPGGRGDAADLWNHEAWQEFTLAKTKAKLKAVDAAIKVYRTQHEDKPPAKLEDLAELFTEGFKDGWGNALTYVPPSAGAPMVLASLGYNGVAGGDGIDADLDVKDVP